jgi:hypothetical protein
LSDALPHVRWRPIRGTLDVEQPTDAVERFLGERRSSEVKVIELATHVFDEYPSGVDRPSGDGWDDRRFDVRLGR